MSGELILYVGLAIALLIGGGVVCWALAHRRVAREQAAMASRFKPMERDP